MSCLGVHFALTREEEERLLAAKGDEAIMEVVEEIEQRWDGPHLAQSDKAWDAIHRCLSDGTLDDEGGSPPLNRCVLGGKHLHEGDDYIVCYVTSSQVKEVAAALAGISETWFRDRYFALDPDNYEGEIGEEDFGYTWEWFQSVRRLFGVAAGEGRSVLFTADQ